MGQAPQSNISIGLSKTCRGSISSEPDGHGALSIPSSSGLRILDGLACIWTVEYTGSHNILRVFTHIPLYGKNLHATHKDPTTYSYPPSMRRKALRSRGFNFKSSLQEKNLHSRDFDKLYTTI